jgi:hypothetical protein
MLRYFRDVQGALEDSVPNVSALASSAHHRLWRDSGYAPLACWAVALVEVSNTVKLQIP